MNKNFTALIIMDGYGLTKDKVGNAVLGNSPFVGRLLKEYPSTRLKCSGAEVGLPDGQMGNSEVGHLNIGAGRVVFQELPRITNAIKDGSFFKNEALLDLADYVKTRGTKVHVMGLVSDGGVHSSMNHLFALLEFFKRQGLKNAYVHCFLDGRDVPPKSALSYLDELQSYMTEINFGKIASVCGRYYAMDRDNRWERVAKAYDLLVKGEGNKAADYKQAINDSYADGVTDEFVLPCALCDGQKPIATISDGDGVVFFNFRSDRPRELTRAFVDDDFNGFDRTGKKVNVKWVCMTEYDKNIKNVEVAFKPNKPKNTLGEYLASCGKKQLRIAETEKYAHVTFFFNGGEEKPNAGEQRVLIDSPKVATYDLQPEMSALLVTERALKELSTGNYDAMILNFANCDMVGHTGNFEAAQKAVKTVDDCVKRLTEYVVDNGGTVFITADHGNAEKMFDEQGKICTSHTTNDVPFIMVSKNCDGVTLKNGGLCDIAPTMLQALNLPQPQEMTGKSLIVR